MVNQVEIAERVVESILAQKLAPGERLGEQQLADLFGVGRTLVREALMRLHARGFVEVRARKGWYVVEPSMANARDAFSARRAVESGMLREAGQPLQDVVMRLRKHIRDERDAIDGDDPANRAFLLADFHVCLAECLGHTTLTSILRDLTARTTLVSSLYQSTHDANQSCVEHEAIVNAVAEGDFVEASRLMVVHIGHVEASLGKTSNATLDATARLRASLEPRTEKGIGAVTDAAKLRAR